MSQRQGETARTWFRVERCFNVAGQWFVATREGSDLGPFASKDAARQAIPRYLKALGEQKVAGVYARKIALNDLWGANLYS